MHITKKQLQKALNTKEFSRFADEIEKLPAASWLFVTHNRCPFANPEKNPLVWSFQTLLNNNLYKINDFVVVDDCSRDHTKSSIDWLSKQYNIKINYIKNKTRRGCSGSRKIGLEYTKNNLVFMGDDDCLYSKYFLVGSMLTYKIIRAQKLKEKIAVINLPVYEKRFYPVLTVEQKIIGKVMLNKTFFYHKFDCFPREYLYSPRYLDKYKIIFRPFRVDTFKGVNLCDKKLILRAGNYMDLKMWPSSYSEHIELSYKLKTKGFSIYHQPDPKFSCLHLKYGNRTKDKFDKRFYYKKIKGLKYYLGQMINWAQTKRLNTGARVNINSFYENEVGSFFSFYLKISNKLGLKFVKNQYRVFVENGQTFSTTPLSAIRNKRLRKHLFSIGIKKGIEAAEIQTGKNYQKIWQQIIRETTNK